MVATVNRWDDLGLSVGIQVKVWSEVLGSGPMSSFDGDNTG
jgi:hypothetical protein